MAGRMVCSHGTRPPVQTSDGSRKALGCRLDPSRDEPTAEGPIPSLGQGKLRHT